MTPLIWLLFVLAVVAAFTTIPAIRYTLIGVAGLLLIGIFYLFFTSQIEEQAELTRISADELEFNELQIDLNRTAGQLKGRVVNMSSDYTLRRVRLDAKIYDCANQSEENERQGHSAIIVKELSEELRDSSDCVVIGEKVAETSNRLWVGVPPGQTRDLNITFAFRAIPKVRGTAYFTYDVIEIRAN